MTAFKLTFSDSCRLIRPLVAAALVLASAAACAPAPAEEVTLTDETDSTWSSTELGDPSDSTPRSCAEGPDDLGAWYGILDPSAVGAAPYEEDAGLSALANYTPAVAYGYAAVDLLLEDALVTMVGDDTTTDFWIEDGLTAVRVSLEEPLEVGVAPGDLVNLVVKQVREYEGQIHITLVGALIVEGTDHPVPVRDAGPIDHSATGAVVHHRFGEILEQLTGCPGHTCFAVQAGEQVVEMWLPDDRGVVAGDCVEVVSPVGTNGERSFVDVPIWDQFRFY